MRRFPIDIQLFLCDGKVAVFLGDSSTPLIEIPLEDLVCRIADGEDIDLTIKALKRTKKIYEELKDQL